MPIFHGSYFHGKRYRLCWWHLFRKCNFASISKEKIETINSSYWAHTLLTTLQTEACTLGLLTTSTTWRNTWTETTGSIWTSKSTNFSSGSGCSFTSTTRSWTESGTGAELQTSKPGQSQHLNFYTSKPLLFCYSLVLPLKRLLWLYLAHQPCTY